MGIVRRDDASFVAADHWRAPEGSLRPVIRLHRRPDAARAVSPWCTCALTTRTSPWLDPRAHFFILMAKSASPLCGLGCCSFRSSQTPWVRVLLVSNVCVESPTPGATFTTAVLLLVSTRVVNAFTVIMGGCARRSMPLNCGRPAGVALSISHLYPPATKHNGGGGTVQLCVYSLLACTRLRCHRPKLQAQASSGQ